MVTEKQLEEIRKARADDGISGLVATVFTRILRIEKFIRSHEQLRNERKTRFAKEMHVDANAFSGMMDGMHGVNLGENPLGLLDMMRTKMEDMTREKKERTEMELKEDDKIIFDKIEISDEELAEAIYTIYEKKSDGKAIENTPAIDNKLTSNTRG